MVDYPVSNDSQFSSARSSAGAGDTITLANGTYSGFTWSSKLVGSGSPLTIQAANRNAATISSTMTINNCSGLTFDGINFNGGQEKSFGTLDRITFQYCYLTAVIRWPAATNCTLQYSEVESAGLYADQSSGNIVVRENYMHTRRGDMMNFTGNCSGIDVLNNVMYDLLSETRVYDPHWDLCLQMFSVGGVAPSNFNIRGNVVIDNPATVILRKDDQGNPISDGESQGIFCGNGGGTYINGVIEQNLIWVQNANGIRFTNTGSGCVVRNNSLINGSILVNNQSGYPYSLPITDNIAPIISDEGTGGGSPTLSGNIQFGGTPSSAYDDPNPTNGYLDYRRFISSAYPTKGAAARIAEIIAGTNVYALNLAGMPAVGGGSPPPSISDLTISLASA